MTKRDSSFADLESPRNLMSFPRRHSAQHGSGAASSSSNATILLHRQIQCCPGHTTRSPLRDVLKQDRQSKTINMAILPWSLQFLYHLSIHQALQWKHIRYNRSCHRTIECSTLTSSQKSFRLPSQAKAVV